MLRLILSIFDLDMKAFLGTWIFTICCVTYHTIAQIEVKGDSQFQWLADSAKRNKAPMMGFRVVLAFESNKALVDSLKLKFQELHPKIEAYVIYEPPNFRLVVGDYRTEIEAQSLVKKLPLEFPLSLVQKMPINLPRID
jgi:hypothetical protein